MKPPDPFNVPKSNPLYVRIPCVFCGERLTQEDKKTHACWEKKKTS